MIVLTIRKQRLFLLVITILFFCVSCYSYAQTQQNKLAACSLDDNLFLEKVILSSFKHKEVDIVEGSAEGGIGKSYWNKNVLVAIKVSYFGETGKTEINYYFNPDNNKQYLVELTDYHYTVPIDYPDSKTASLSTYKFMVCEGGEPNYPGSDDLAGVYNRAVNTLTVIRKSLKISP